MGRLDGNIKRSEEWDKMEEFMERLSQKIFHRYGPEGSHILAGKLSKLVTEDYNNAIGAEQPECQICGEKPVVDNGMCKVCNELFDTLESITGKGGGILG